MVDINQIYKSQGDYIKAEDIGNNMWTFTIRTADVKRFDDGSSKIILTFLEWDRGLPLNVTNARAIADLYGHDSNGWVGRQIMLFSMPVKFQDRMVNAVRVRAPMQNQAQPVQAQPAPRQPGQIQPQATTHMPPQQPPATLQNSPQRPLQPAQGYAQQSGGQRPFAPPAELNDEIPF